MYEKMRGMAHLSIPVVLMTSVLIVFVARFIISAKRAYKADHARWMRELVDRRQEWMPAFMLLTGLMTLNLLYDLIR